MKKTYPKFFEDRGATGALLNSRHPLNICITEFITNLQIEDLEVLVGDALGGHLSVALSERFFGHDLTRRERQSAYANASVLKQLPAGVLADRYAPLKAVGVTKDFRTIRSLWEETVMRIDYRTGKKGWLETGEKQSLTIEAVSLRARDSRPAASEIEDHAVELHTFSSSQERLFELTIAGSFSEAFRAALHIADGGVRRRAIGCVAFHYVAFSVEHLQRAVAWVMAVRRCSVPEPLRDDINVGASFRVGGAASIDSHLTRMFTKLLRKYEPDSAARKLLKFTGPTGPLEMMLHNILKKRFEDATEGQIKAWHAAIAALVRQIMQAGGFQNKSLPAADPKIEMFTHWFGRSERQMLLTIALRVQQARAIAESIIANPEKLAGADLETLLYPTVFPGRDAGLEEDAQSLCVRMLLLAGDHGDDVSDAAANAPAKKPLAGAFTLLSEIQQRRRAATLHVTRAEQFFAAFDPLAESAGRSGPTAEGC